MLGTVLGGEPTAIGKRNRKKETERKKQK